MIATTIASRCGRVSQICAQRCGHPTVGKRPCVQFGYQAHDAMAFHQGVCTPNYLHVGRNGEKTLDVAIFGRNGERSVARVYVFGWTCAVSILASSDSTSWTNAHSPMSICPFVQRRPTQVRSGAGNTPGRSSAIARPILADNPQ